MCSAAALGVAMLAFGGCGSHGAGRAAEPTTATVAPSTTTTLSVAALGQQYLAIVAPLNAALTTFGTAVAALGESPRASALQAAAAPFVAAQRTADEKLLRVAWPPSVKADVDAFVTADRALETSLGSAGAQNALTASAWEARVTADEGRLSAAVSIIRGDLGLPPSPT